MTPGPSLGPYHIIYRDFAGDLSQRDIAIRQVRRVEGDLEVRAWCHLHHDERTFLASRILEIIDLSTGQPDRNASAVLGPMVADEDRPVPPPLRRGRGTVVAASLILTCVIGLVVLLTFLEPSPPAPADGWQARTTPAPVEPVANQPVNPVPVAANSTVAAVATSAMNPVVVTVRKANRTQTSASSSPARHRLRRHISRSTWRATENEPPF